MESPCFSRPQSTASHLFARTRSFHRPTYKRPGAIAGHDYPLELIALEPAIFLGEQGWRSGESVICELSLLLVLFLAPRGFSPGPPVFPSSKTNISKFRFDLELSSTLSRASGSGDCASTPCV